MTYLTDSRSLYEVVGEQADRNFGLAGGFIRTTIIRDCRTEDTRALDDLTLLAYETVVLEEAA